MNSKVVELGCTNTNFVNAHGYHNDNHYTTAQDMIKILNYCIKNDTFKKISSTKSHIIEPTNKTTSQRFLQNTNRLLQTKKDSIYARPYEYCLGGKTGYTEQAGRCLVAFGKKDNKDILVGTFNAMNDDKGLDAKFTDTINIFEYCFNNFEEKIIIEKANYSFDYTNEDVHSKYTLYVKDDISSLVKKDFKVLDNLEYKTSINYAKLSFKEKDANYKEPYGTITFTINSDLNEKQNITKNLYLKEVEDLFYISKSFILICSIILITIIVLLILFKFKKNLYIKKSKIISNKNTKNATTSSRKRNRK